MRNKFDEQLHSLNQSMIDMGLLCEKAIELSIDALLKGDLKLAKEAVLAEKQIDQLERDIEATCMKLLISQQPVAKDMRLISSALKMVTDMERIGDQAEDIAEIVTYIDLSDSKNNQHIKDMTKAVTKMVKDSVEAYVKKDLKGARDVIAYDDKVDRLFCEIKKDLILLIATDSNQGEKALDLLMIAKYLERIGDHATNIAEWVEYSITGRHNMITE